MRKPILFIAAIFLSISCLADESQDITKALSWLKVLDAGEYAESWDQTAPFFQKQVSSAKWVQTLNKARTPLGKVISREVTKSSSHTTLPRVPKGSYTVISLNTNFEHKPSATETITVTQTDSQWLIIGYFIK